MPFALFKNLTLYRLPLAARGAIESLPDCLAEHALRPLGQLELSTAGFISPFGRNDAPLSHRVGHALLLTLGVEEKLLPPSVVNAELSRRIDAVRVREGRSPGGRERKRLKDDVLTELLPRAFSRPRQLCGYIDMESGWLVIDTASNKQGELFVNAIREALGSFPALPVNPESSPRALLTGWVSGDELPAGWQLGDEVELQDPVDKGAKWSGRRAELDSDECREHLKAGKQTFRLGITVDDRLSLVVCEDMVVRKLKFLETAMEAVDQTEHESVQQEMDAVFTLMTGELKPLLRHLADVFQLSTAG